MAKQSVYAEDVAGGLIRQAHADVESLYVPGFAEWAQVNHPDLVSAVVSAFKAIDVPCDRSDVQGLHAGLESIRSAAADLAGAWRRQLGGDVVTPPPAPPSLSAEKNHPMVIRSQTDGVETHPSLFGAE